MNATGTKNIADVCKELDCKMVYLSTIMYSTARNRSLVPDCKDYKPLNVYGETKLAGNCQNWRYQRHCPNILSCGFAWVFGKNGKNFIKTMLNIARRMTRSRLSMIRSERPKNILFDLARLLVDMIETDKYGYHATNEGGYISWYDFTKEIFRQAVELEEPL